jgi:hypothetical protein
MVFLERGVGYLSFRGFHGIFMMEMLDDVERESISFWAGCVACNRHRLKYVLSENPSTPEPTTHPIIFIQ